MPALNLRRRKLTIILMVNAALGVWVWNSHSSINSRMMSMQAALQQPQYGDLATSKPSHSALRSTTTIDDRDEMQMNETCPVVTDLMQGNLNVTFNAKTNGTNWPPTFEEIAVSNPGLRLGGHYDGPDYCTPQHNIAILIPFRDRHKHLRYLLHYLHMALQHQQARYTVIVAEQEGTETFNKGQLMNTAFSYAANMPGENFTCFFFHDVDVISENDRLIYRCRGEDKVVHLGSNIDKFNYDFCCGMTVGGVLGVTKHQFLAINGFSNVYYGWGGEDDDINARIKLIGKLGIYRPGKDIGRFKMVPHQHDERNPLNPKRHELLKNWRSRQSQDGINSLDTTIVNVVKYFTHTRLLVKVKPG